MKSSSYTYCQFGLPVPKLDNLAFEKDSPPSCFDFAVKMGERIGCLQVTTARNCCNMQLVSTVGICATDAELVWRHATGKPTVVKLRPVLFFYLIDLAGRWKPLL